MGEHGSFLATLTSVSKEFASFAIRVQEIQGIALSSVQFTRNSSVPFDARARAHVLFTES